jgi:hypothetical protein
LAKIIMAHSFKGEFDFETMTIHEYDKKTEETRVYNLLDALKQYDGYEISISFKKEDAPAESEE